MAWLARLHAFVISTIGLGFVFAGGVKLQDPQQVRALFASWGLAAGWLVTTAGWVEVMLGSLLFWAPTRRLGSLAMMGWMLCFGLLQVRAAQPSGALASAAVFAVSFGWVLLRGRASRGLPIYPPTPLRDAPNTLGRACISLVQLVGLAFLFRWAVGGTVYWMALPLLAWAQSHQDSPSGPPWWEVVMLYLLVLGLGTSGLWAFTGHTFMSETVSTSVGWDPSPYQKELAFYHLGIGLAGLSSWWIRDQFWVALAGIASVFLYGAGWVHLNDFLLSGNDAPANWGGSVLFGNAILPTVLIGLAAVRLRSASRGNAVGDPAGKPSSSERLRQSPL